MDYKLITKAEYMNLLKRLDKIDDTISCKIKPAKKIYCETDLTELLSASKRTLINWRKQGLIKYSKIQGKIYYTWEQIEEFLKSNEVADHLR